MISRVWIRSGITEDLDAKQQRLLDLVLENIRNYYRDLHQTRPCYQYPLSLSRLSKLCNRSGSQVLNAVRILANSIPASSAANPDAQPPIFYDRIQAEKNKSHRPYRIFLKRKV